MCIENPPLNLFSLSTRRARFRAVCFVFASYHVVNLIQHNLLFGGENYIIEPEVILKENEYFNDMEEHLWETWLNEQRRNLDPRNRTMILLKDDEPVILQHRGASGLGHNLLRFSSTFHFARGINLKRFYASWNPWCGDEDPSCIYDIPTFLFGPGPFVVSPPPFTSINNVSFPSSWPIIKLMSTNDKSFPNKEVKVMNEVPGYNYVNTNNVYRKKIRKMMEDVNQKYASSLFYGKVNSDIEFYQQLLVLFRGKGRARDIMRRTGEIIAAVSDSGKGTNSDTEGRRRGWDRYTVFGLHVRAGNGETGDFEKRQLKFGIDSWINNTIDMLHDYIYNSDDAHEQYFIDKPPAIFIATDTLSIVDKMRTRSARIPIFSVTDFGNSVPLIKEGAGVSWKYENYTTKEQCLKGWEDMFLDMYLLCKCNTVIAGQYSSFTQAAPLSLIFHKAGKRKASIQKRLQKESVIENNVQHHDDHPSYFCAVGAHGDNMACYDNFLDWYNRSINVFIGNAESPQHAYSNLYTIPSYNTLYMKYFVWYDGSAINVTYQK